MDAETAQEARERASRAWEAMLQKLRLTVVCLQRTEEHLQATEDACGELRARLGAAAENFSEGRAVVEMSETPAKN